MVDYIFSASLKQNVHRPLADDEAPLLSEGMLLVFVIQLARMDPDIQQ